MSDNLGDAFNNLKKMIDSNALPNDVQNLVNNLNSNNNKSNQTLNDMLSKVSPEMLNNLSSMLQSNNSGNNSGSSSIHNNTSFSSASSSTDDSSSFNLDINTIMKMKSIMETMNQKDNPNANLLKSLKPYLRDSRKGKLDQYVNLLNITKIADVMKKDQKETQNDT